MGTALVIIVVTIVVGSISFLVLGMVRSHGGPKPTGGRRWAAQATLAKMRKEGSGGLPSDVGEEANRSEGPPGAEPRGTPIQGSPPPSGAD